MIAPTIFIDENIPFLPDALSSCGRIIRCNGRALTASDLIRERCSALFVRSITKVNSSLLSGTSVQFVGTATAGIDHIDTQFLEKSGVHFASAAGSNANAVAEYVIFSMLERYHSIRGKTIGIIGYGNIGRRVAEYCRRLGAYILLNDLPLYAEGYDFPEWALHGSVMQLCYDADIITNHVPLTRSGEYATLGLLGTRELGAMQPDAMIIHASRGGVVDESVLLTLLRTTNAQAAMDVWEGEPFIEKELAEKAMIATPHIAGYSWNAKLTGARMMAEAYCTFSGCNADFTVFDILHPSLHTAENERELHTILGQRRSFLSDSGILKSGLHHSGDERAAHFDRQRKDYPERFEFLKL
jgi:erythronate-4-phosphate dehydrogenase